METEQQNKPRFFIDERLDGIAIIDRYHPEHKGLSKKLDTPDVVESFWWGYGGGEWERRAKTANRFKQKCETLNSFVKFLSEIELTRFLRLLARYNKG